MNKTIRSCMQWSFRLMVAVVLVMGSLGPAFSSPAMAQGTESTLSAFFSFLSAPLVGEAAELVLTVSSTVATEVSTQIVLPDGIVLLEGDLEGRGSASPGADWQQAIVVQVVLEGEFKITAELEAANQEGTAVRGQAHIYVASAADQASASELEVAIPDARAIAPSEDEASKAPVGAVEVREAQDELELTVDAEQGRVTLGDDTPAVPSTGEGIAALGRVGELVIGTETNQVTLGDGSPNAPLALSEADEKAEPGSKEGPAILNVKSEWTGGEGELSVRTEAGLRTVGDDSPDAPQEVQELTNAVEAEQEGQDLALQVEEHASSIVGVENSPDEPVVAAKAEAEIAARQESGEAILVGEPAGEPVGEPAGEARTSLVEPEGEPWAEPQEGAAPVPEIEVDALDGELAIESGTDLIAVRGDSPEAPQKVACR